ncbi:hypothetical protein [Azospirillum brasilense]|uniref:hypothetical protein n=1 Tax=Azospirillum brasilense TaxID=192 RepID=UPI0011C3A79C|nr:hypothetical protein [Azospirillum brasilense]NUB28122.1 hypothetical protein [Azospirillum brasilense]NUB33229.1 hypothetical protein [Azospirillum brasilense]
MRIGMLLIIAILAVPPVAMGAETRAEFGAWQVVYKENGFGEKSAYINHKIDDAQGMQISCKNKKYVALVKHKDPVNWNIPTISVKYKIGDAGAVIKEDWKHVYKLDLTVKDDVNELVKAMSISRGKFVFSVLVTEFAPELDEFGEAAAEVWKFC